MFKLDSNKLQTDKQFFNSLKNYQPLFYLGKGDPIFLLNHKWHSSFLLVTGCSVAYAFCIWFLLISNIIQFDEEDSPTKRHILEAINFFMLSGLVISYLITQFVNPGIKNPSMISEGDFFRFGKKYCYICEKDVLQTMFHCSQCLICINKKDHHCLFFEKCMGGDVQNYGFKFFLLFACMSCVTLFTTLILYLI